MVDSSQAYMADAAVRARVDEVLDRVGLDLEEVPPAVIERVAARTRHPESRLSVGRYLVVGELGRGGMGVVYEAWDPGIDRHVAIKTIEPELVPEEEREEVIERFKREVKIVGRLHHPAIVTIYDSGLERERDPITNRRVPSLYYYVMEYLEGRSLARILRERRRLPDEVAVAIAADIAEALHLSHEAGIIHRDIKPSNIFLRNEREAVLLDFGIAKTGSVALTRQGQILGTPSYLAPERLREKERPIDGRADIFSLGVLLFTMLTGEAPFVGDDVYEVIDKIAKQSHPKLGRDTPSGQALSRVIDRMLAKDPSERYQSAEEAAQALRRVHPLFFNSLIPGPTDLDEEATSEREKTSPSAPTPMVDAGSARADSSDTGEADTGRMSVPDRKAGPPPLPPPIPTEPAQPMPPPGEPAPNTELLEDAVRDVSPPPGLPTKVTPPPPADTETEDVDSAPGTPNAATEIAKAHGAVRVADVLGTRPELALQRETRELRQEREQIPNIEDLVREEFAHDDEDDEPPHIEDTSPSIPFPTEAKVTEESEAYEDHATHNEEATDDETVADPARRIPSDIRKAPLKAHIDPQETEQVVRARRPPPADTQPTRDDSVPPNRRPRSRRVSIEASLVDEEEVVVKPAPLEALKPDELPTQTGFKLPNNKAQAEVLDGSMSGDVVRARGDSQVQDPAEAGAAPEVRPGAGREVDLDPNAGPAPDLDVPRSAAVARRTFGTSGTPGKKRSPVQVRVSGKPLTTSPDERMRMIRRRGIMLLTATLASVAIGLFLGRMKQPSTTENGDVPGQTTAKGPKVEPRVSARRIPGTNELDLVRPRPPVELMRDAESAMVSGQLEDAIRLYKNAAQALGPEHELHAQALLGHGDALNKYGRREEAIEVYKGVRRQHPKSVEAKKAKVALVELGVTLRRRPAPPPSGVAPPPAAPPPAGSVERLQPVEKKRKVVQITSDMSVDSKCLAILQNYINDSRGAVRALEALRSEHPNGACVYWNLGRKYQKTNRLRSAVDAYKRYLRLDPNTPRRPAIEDKIANLEAKLRQ